ncbi:hypothetical protein EZ449_16635 [Pedobacter frigidisoli]|uniref:Uncharacterized protein n=1 Tax=Pedobacter frigidisoli TaxID=2530455 RepID=A0A4R0NTF7_9SPHI|nr:hypothetical protein [Pedobacter frigidisoli]TCD04577.1 hypothetical protein EZ449_16635 [Pedobacter frigidisoli]
MDLQSEKLNVLQKIINSDDESLIRDIKSLIYSRDLDWFNGLNRNQQNDVREGINQLDAGESFSHEETKRRFSFE